MVRRGGRSRRLGEGGFTVVELLIYFIIAVVVITGIYQLLIGQNRLYMKQRELQDVRTTLRGAANLLAYDLRQASASDGDLYSISADSFAIRSIQGTAILCGEHQNQPRYGLWGVSGEFAVTSDDSALIYAAGDVGPADDTWRVVAQDKLLSGKGGVGRCGWGDKAVGKGKGKTKGVGPIMNGVGVPEIVIEVDGDVTGVYLGAPWRAFRKVTYGLFQQSGRWWLGRKVGSSGTWELLAGPLRAPQDSGLYLSWYDRYGNPTANPTQVGLVDIILRGESLGKVPKPGEAPGYQGDTLTVRVSLRG